MLSVNSVPIKDNDLPFSLDVLKDSKIGLWAIEYDDNEAPRMYGNEIMMDIVGVTPGTSPEVMYRTWVDMIERDDYEKVHEAFKIMRSGSHAEFQYLTHYDDGRVMISRCEGSFNPKYTKGQRIEGIHRNITDLANVIKEKKLKEEVAKNKQIIDSFISSYILAYRVNLSDNSFTLLRMDENVKGFGIEFDYFSDALSYFVNEIVFEPDKETMIKETSYDRIRERLKEVPSYSVEYRALLDGVPYWHIMQVSSLGKDEVGIAFNELNTEIILKHLNEKMYDDYFSLFSIDFDHQSISVIKESPYYTFGPVGTVMPYSKAIAAFGEAFSGDTREFFNKMTDINYAKKVFASEDKFTYSYKSEYGDKKIVTISGYVVIKHDDGSPAVFTFGFSLLDTFASERVKLQEKIHLALQEANDANRKLKEQQIFLNYFVKSYDSAFSVDLSNGKIEILNMTNEFKRIFTFNGNTINIEHFIENHIYEEDKKDARMYSDKEYITSRLRQEPNYTFTIREVYDEKVRIKRCLIVRGIDEYHIAVGFMDITDELKKENEKREMLEKALKMAEASNRSKTTFLNSISHDIRTPMNAIMGYSSLIEKNIDNKNAILDYLSKINTSSAHLLSLFNQILDMSRIEAGEIKIENNKENIISIANELRDIVSIEINRKHHKLTANTSGVKNPNILCDKLHLNQVLINVLSNAIKYTPDGGSIFISLDEKPTDKENVSNYIFRFVDNGIGMSEELQKTVFEPFVRATSSTVSGIQGIGLGMAIAKRFIDLMNGEIVIQSKLDHGTEITITFPFEHISNVKEIEVKEEKTLTHEFTGKKVLIVEDNEFNLEITKELLSEYGFICDCVNDGIYAVEAVMNKGTNYYDFILMDIQMPQMNGYAATKEIRKLEGGKNVPIIALSANSFKEDTEKSLASGMNAHISKPISIDNLLETLSYFY